MFSNLFESGSRFLKSFKHKNVRQIAELQKIEKELDTFKKKEEKINQNLVFTNRTFLKFWLIGMFVVFLAYIIFKSLDIIYLILTAYILSVAVEAVIEFFQSRKISRGLSILLAYLLFVLIFLGALIFIVPFLLDQVSQVLKIFTMNFAYFQQLLETRTIAEVIRDYVWLPGALKDTLLSSMNDPAITLSIQDKLQSNISQIISMGTSSIKGIGNVAVNFVGSFFSFVTQSSIVLTLSVLFSISKDSVISFIGSLGGEKKRDYVKMKLTRIYKKLGIWLKSQFILCVFIGLTMYVSFWILSLFGIDLPQKGSLAVIGGLTEIIPYVGPILGGFLAIFVAFIHYGVYAALIVLAIVLAIQWFENNVLVPLVMNKTLGVNPIIIFISMIIGGLIIGFIGVLLAVPIAVIITLIFEKTFDE